MSKPPKIEKKVLKEPDSFQVRGSAVLGYLANHQHRFITVVAVALLLVAGVYAMDWWQGRSLEKHWQEYYGATKLPETQRWEKLKAVWSDNKNARPGFFAAVMVADHYFAEAKKELVKDAAKPSTNAPLAAEWYGHALELSDMLPAEKQLLTLNRGNANELQKKYDEALSDYKAASDMTGEAKALAMLELARVYELKNDTANATATYEKVSADFQNTEYAKLAKNHLRRMKSPLLQALSPKTGR